MYIISYNVKNILLLCVFNRRKRKWLFTYEVEIDDVSIVLVVFLTLVPNGGLEEQVGETP